MARIKTITKRRIKKYKGVYGATPANMDKCIAKGRRVIQSEGMAKRGIFRCDKPRRRSTVGPQMPTVKFLRAELRKRGVRGIYDMLKPELWEKYNETGGDEGFYVRSN